MIGCKATCLTAAGRFFSAIMIGLELFWYFMVAPVLINHKCAVFENRPKKSHFIDFTQNIVRWRL